MDLRRLEYFGVLAEELHFRKAAEKLYISQPALSRQIQELEFELGISLFERNNRNVQLTPAGRYLKDQVGQLQERLTRIQRNVRRIGEGSTGELQIGFVGSAMQSVIPEALKKLNHLFPEIQTYLQELSNQEQIKAVLSEKLDVGFVRSEHFPVEISSQLVLEESFVLVLPKNHWLTTRKLINTERLKGEKFILFGTSYSLDYYELILSIFSGWGFKPEVSHRSVHAATIFHLVESQLGIAIVPASLTLGFDLKIKFIELKNIPQKTRLYMIWKSDHNNPLLDNFTALF
ncbi:MAG: LysR family transcriptional regulator [Saprospiraceae bacterium]|nr:LysR family transcriptional regulator [Saprospiraceae bacterium]